MMKYVLLKGIQKILIGNLLYDVYKMNLKNKINEFIIIFTIH